MLSDFLLVAGTFMVAVEAPHILKAVAHLDRSATAGHILIWATGCAMLVAGWLT